jgi:hypothetical protein
VFMLASRLRQRVFERGGSGRQMYARGEPILRMTGVDGQHASAGFALP